MTRPASSTTRYQKMLAFDGLELLTAQRHTTAFPWHAHENFTLSLVTAGTESLQLPDKVLYVPAGSLSLTHPQQVHATPLVHPTGYSFHTFYLSPALLTRLAGGHPPCFAQGVIQQPALFARFERVAQLFAKAGPLFEDLLVSALRELIRSHSRPGEQPDQEAAAWVLAVQQTLASHLLDPPPLARVARQYGWSSFQLLRYFKQHTGLTPYGYLLLRRIDAAKHLLAQGCPLAETALEVGFYDQAHLTRFFRRFVGVSPGRYQASVRPVGRNIVQD